MMLALYLLAMSCASAAPLSLKDSVRFALDHSPGFDSAKKTQLVRELERRNSIAKILPSLDLSTTNGLQNNIPISSTNATLLTPNPAAPWYSSFNLGLTENLYDNGISLTGIDVANLNRDLAAIGLLKSRDSLTLDIVTEFYRLSLASMLLEVKRQQEAVLEKQFKTLSSEYTQGFKTRSDYLRLKAQVQRAEIDRISTENSLDLATTELRRLMGSEPSATTVTFEPLHVDPAKVDQVSFPETPPLFENLYDYKITKIQEDINGKNVSLVKRNYWPQASVSSGVAYSNQNYLNSSTAFSAGHQLSWNALLLLQYNIWDWGTRKRNVEISEYNQDIQEDTLNQGLYDLHSKTASLMSNLQRIKRNYQLNQELLVLEEKSNRDLESQYREGKVTYLDLITELNSLLDAKVQFYTAHFEALTTLAQYRFYEGTIYESIFEK